jgi:hypothetical protein
MAVAAWHRKRAMAAFLLILVAEDDDKLPRPSEKPKAADKVVYHHLLHTSDNIFGITTC